MFTQALRARPQLQSKSRGPICPCSTSPIRHDAACRWELPQQLGGHQQHSFTMTMLLCLLIVLHAYWFHLIVRIALDFVRTGTKRDVRESKD